MRTEKPTHPGYLHLLTDFKCDYCGTLAYTKKSHYERNKRHFCSIRCYSKFREHFLPKEEQHAFGKGVGEEERIKRKKARNTLNHYLRDKSIKRPNCEICGGVAEAHHDDYDKPLDVRWLCFEHHRLYHKIGLQIYRKPRLTSY
jgi:hypothetical protein